MSIKLPKKITPDRIRESIVQIFFNSDIPFEPLVGYLHRLFLSRGYDYTNRPIRQFPLNPELLPLDSSSFEISLTPQHFFFNEEIKIQLHQNNSLIFNCTNNYIGWTRFYSAIEMLLKELYQEKLISNFTRVGIRYVSEFPNIDILEKVNFGFQMSVLNTPISNGTFRVEWRESQHRIIVNLGSKLPINSLIEPDGSKVEFVSLIDVDVINQEFEPCEFTQLLSFLDDLHSNQKTVFFGLLKEEFLKSLNPEY